MKKKLLLLIVLSSLVQLLSVQAKLDCPESFSHICAIDKKMDNAISLFNCELLAMGSAEDYAWAKEHVPDYCACCESHFKKQISLLDVAFSEYTKLTLSQEDSFLERSLALGILAKIKKNRELVSSNLAVLNSFMAECEQDCEKGAFVNNSPLTNFILPKHLKAFFKDENEFETFAISYLRCTIRCEFGAQIRRFNPLCEFLAEDETLMYDDLKELCLEKMLNEFQKHSGLVDLWYSAVKILGDPNADPAEQQEYIEYIQKMWEESPHLIEPLRV